SAPVVTLNLDGGTLQLNVDGNATAAPVVASTINTGAATTINIGSIANVTGPVQIPLISYGGADPYTALTLGTVPAGYTGATLVDNTGNLSIDLSLSPSVNTTPTNITAVVSGGTLTLSWPADHIGWRLQSQTNALGIGLNPVASAWSDVAGSASVNSVNVTPNPASGAVFYRMVYP
ncbi:MAG: hypothetical protein JF609_03025, partial [Verrucomicrobia bacterium]|nr:hypothetical protein [Verrucomicrobiota bacterium]